MPLLRGRDSSWLLVVNLCELPGFVSVEGWGGLMDPDGGPLECPRLCTVEGQGSWLLEEDVVEVPGFASVKGWRELMDLGGLLHLMPEQVPIMGQTVAIFLGDLVSCGHQPRSWSSDLGAPWF